MNAKKKKRMSAKVAALLLVVAAATGVLVWLVLGTNVAVLEPAGSIAERQRGLIIFASLLSLIVIVPVFTLTFYIAWKYRASNKKAKYRPDWDHHTGIELLWWAIPLALITVLSVVTWKTSHELDPFKPLDSDKKPLTVQVVALQWKWLFIYPEQNIASVNLVQFPEDRPVNFRITSDAPMNSFWIPQLGGQIYAMSGMSTKLHLIAEEPGTYRGSSANISGEGFSDMVFSAKATSEAEFEEWVRTVKDSPDQLDVSAYGELAEPGTPDKILYYGSVERGLYDKVVESYMSHDASRRGRDESHHSEGQ